jgi:carbohydrate-selective porin OprB
MTPEFRYRTGTPRRSNCRAFTLSLAMSAWVLLPGPHVALGQAPVEAPPKAEPTAPGASEPSPPPEIDNPAVPVDRSQLRQATGQDTAATSGDLPQQTGAPVTMPPAALDFSPHLSNQRKALAAKGITFNVNLTIDAGYNLTGGAQTGSFVAGLLDASLQFNAQRLGVCDGGLLLARWQSYQETNPGPLDLIPDYWGWESMASGLGEVNQLSELYWQQKLFEDALTIVFGKQDAYNYFLNPIGPVGYFISNIDTLPATMVPWVPTYPNQAMGLVSVVRPNDFITAKFGWYDGTNVYPVGGDGSKSTGTLGPGTFFNNPGSWFLISELNVAWKLPTGLDGVAGVGGWIQTGPSTVSGIDTPNVLMPSQPTGGWYAQITQRVWDHAPGDANESGLRVYGQIGWGDPASNPVNWSLSGGCVLDGTFPGRTNDDFGVGIGYAWFSDPTFIYPAESGLYELNFEAFYSIAVTDYLTIAPNFQLVSTPGQTGELPLAVVGLIRFSINF